MTREEFDNLIPRKSMVYPKHEGKCVQYMFMGRNEDSTYQLYGKPFGHEDYIIINNFDVVKQYNKR